eukprot:372284_1
MKNMMVEHRLGLTFWLRIFKVDQVAKKLMHIFKTFSMENLLIFDENINNEYGLKGDATNAAVQKICVVKEVAVIGMDTWLWLLIKWTGAKKYIGVYIKR